MAENTKKRSVLFNSAFNLLGWLVPIIILLVTVPIFNNKLGTDQYGIYLLITTIISFVVLLNFGTSESVVKYISEFEFDLRKKNDKVNNIINTSFTLNIITSFMILAIIFFLRKYIVDISISGKFHNKSLYEQSLIYGVIAFCFTMIANTFLSFFRAIQRFEVSSILGIAQSIILNVANVIILYHHGDVRDIMFCTAVISVIYMIFCLGTVSYFYRGYRPRIRCEKRTFNKLFNFSKYTFLMSIIGMIVFNADKLIIGAFLSTKEVAYYGIPANLSMKIQQIIAALVGSLFPKISELFAANLFEDIKVMYIKSYKFTVNIIVALIIPSFIFSRKLLKYWVGNDVALKATFSFKVLLIAYALLALTSVGYFVSYGIDRPSIYTKTYFFMAIINLAFNFTLIPILGINGAAISTLVSNAFVMIMVLKIERILKIKPKVIFKEVYIKAICTGLLQLGITLCLYLIVKNLIGVFLAGSISFISYYIIYTYIFKFEDEVYKSLVSKIRP